LFLGAEEIDRHHGERTLDRGKRAQSAVAAFQFLHDETGRDATESGAAVALDARTKGIEPR